MPFFDVTVVDGGPAESQRWATYLLVDRGSEILILEVQGSERYLAVTVAAHNDFESL